MKFNISKDELTSALNIVSKGIDTRSTLPILSGVLIESNDEGKVVFQTSNLQISIRHACAADIVEQGKIVVPAKLLADIAKGLPDAAVQIMTLQEQVQISCLETSYTLSSLNPIDFPFFPEVGEGTTVKLPTKELSEAVKRVGRAVSRDDSRPVLTGILFSVEGSVIHLAATDSYRLAVADIEHPAGDIDGFSAIVPGKVFEDVAKAAGSVEEISIGFEENQVVFQFGDTVFVSRKVEGNYPNYKQLIPSNCPITIEMNTRALLTAIKRVALLAQSHTPIRFKFSFEEQKATITARTQDVGMASETVVANVDGPDTEIAFNHSYILDGLTALEGDTVIELQSSLKPGILRGSENPNYLYLAMPVRMG